MSSASTPQQQKAPSTSKPKDRGSTKSIWVSFVSGCLGGVANVLSSHPLDTIKVRMQILHLGFLKCCHHMIAKEGLSSLYKGITSPLCNVPIIFAVYFGSYEFSKWLQGVGPREELTVRQSMFAGAFSGFTVTSIRTPVELVKCRLQMEGTGQKGRTITALEMTKDIVRTKGYRELYKGTLITLLREVPAGALYFGTYEIAKKELKTKYGDKQFIPLVAGGLAGLFSWFVSYPQDVIKTKLQCDTREPRKYQQSRIIRDGGIASCAKRVWEKHGPVGFVRGFSACAMKTIVAEAATFFVYENTKKHIAC